MSLTKVLISVFSLLLSTSVFAKPQKILVCHVGNEVGPGGEDYLDDPGCVPIEENGYFCPDAGKIDLISVKNDSQHLGNPSHTYNGISDYLPADVGASGEGNEDSDGDGIDDGCAPPPSGEFSTTQTIKGRTVTCSSATTNETYTECLDLEVDGLSFPNGVTCAEWSTAESYYTSLADFCEYITGSPSFEVYYDCEGWTARATWFGTDWGANDYDNGYSKHLRCNY